MRKEIWVAVSGVLVIATLAACTDNKGQNTSTSSPFPDAPPTPLLEVKASEIPTGILTAESSSTPPEVTPHPHIVNGMIEIPEGTFLEGSTPEQVKQFGTLCERYIGGCTENDFSDELPQHPVKLSTYWFSETEVSNRQFEAFMKAHPNFKSTAQLKGKSLVWDDSLHQFREIPGADPQHPQGHGSSIAQAPNYPVTQVSWTDAQAFCHSNHMKLPTVAQFQRAARGDNGQPYSYPGNEWRPEFVVASGASASPLSPIDQALSISPWGAKHTLGNVAEWIFNWYSSTNEQSGVTVNPTGPDSGMDRVVVGGSRATRAGQMHVAQMVAKSPEYTSDLLGFRCVYNSTTPPHFSEAGAVGYSSR